MTDILIWCYIGYEKFWFAVKGCIDPEEMESNQLALAQVQWDGQ